MFEEFYPIYIKSGFKALKCRGYNSACTMSSKDARTNAKIPHTKGFQKSSYQTLSLDECMDWQQKKGWIGWVVPKTLIALDVDKDITHIDQIDLFIKEKGLSVPIHHTRNGKHYFFKVQDELTANTTALLKIGFSVTYRVGGKSQVILCPMETDRYWDNIDSLDNPSLLPTCLTPLNLKKKEDVLEAINNQLFYYYKKGILSGVFLDFSYTGFLVDDCGLKKEQYMSLFFRLFKDEFDKKQTETMYDRAKSVKEKQSTGTLIKTLQEKNLKHILFLISSISNFKKTPKSPERISHDINEIVDYFNKEHAIVDFSGKITIMKEVYNNELNQNQRIFYDYPNFKRKYQALPPIFINKKPIPQAEIWLGSENRREYDSIDYLPGQDTEHLKIFNVWAGFSVKPKEGKCDKYLAHIYEVISNNNDSIYNYILNWMADAVQNLRERLGVSIVLTGRQGVGKGVFSVEFGKIWGEHFLAIGRSDALVNNFNSELMGKSLVYADEAFWGGDKQISGILKSMITEDSLRIEYKRKEAIYVRNYVRLIAASNNDRVVPAEMGERRYFVINVSDVRKQDYNYFKEITNEMQNGGRAALLKLLLERDISNVDIRDFPKTKALSNQKMHNLSSIDNFLFHLIDVGDINKFVKSLTNITFKDTDYFDTFKIGGGWLDQISSQLLHKIYLWWSSGMKERHPCISIQNFSAKVTESIGAECKRIKLQDGSWVRGYYLLPIDETLKHFEMIFGQGLFQKDLEEDVLGLDET